MDYVYVGRIITTHGLKGEVKVRSNFKFKDKVFIKGFKLYIGTNKEEHEILSYRKHKDYDMLVLTGIDDIDKAISYKQKLVFINRCDLVLNEDYLDEDLIGLDGIYNDKNIGKVVEVLDQGNKNIVIKLDNGIYIPRNDNFILKVDFSKKIIIFKNLEGLL